MKRNILLVALFVSIMFAGQAMANQDWKINGTWNYELAVQGEFEGNPATLEESGSITMFTLPDGTGGEILDSFSITANGSVTTGNGTYDYTYQNAEYFEPLAYTPGTAYNIEYDTAIDEEPVTFILQGVQTGEYLFEGTATVVVRGESFTGTLRATKPAPVPTPSSDGGGSSGCNFIGTTLLSLLALPIFFKKRNRR